MSLNLRHFIISHRCFLTISTFSRKITTGNSQQHPPKSAAKLEPIDDIEIRNEQDRVPETSSVPPKRELPIPRVPSRPGLGNKDDLESIIKSWQRQLPHDDDPIVFEEVTDENFGDQSFCRRFGRHLFPTEKVVWWSSKWDISLAGIRRWIERRVHTAQVREQRFLPMRHGILGPDLAAAHFVCYRGGRVKFFGHSEWWTGHDRIPKVYTDNFLIEKIDATGLDVIWGGLDNFINLYHLEDLNLTNCQQLDVWCFDKIYRQYRFSTKLRRLNVSQCKGFCEYSLMYCYRIPSLKEIIITGTKAANYRFLPLTVHLLQDIRPDLKVVV